MNSKYVCGAELAYKGEDTFAVDCMGIFDSVEEAVLENKKLHVSFGHNIYEVRPETTHGLIRAHGICQGAKRSGYKIIRLACKAYDHEAWEPQK